MRRIAYASGTRADFGLMRSALQRIHGSDQLDLRVLVTGMHLSEEFGLTVSEIEAAGLPIAARVPVSLSPRTGATMGRAIATALHGFVDALEAWRPDLLLVLGDRGEMLAATLAAVHLNIPVAHIHGGERSGTVDESVRHAITKLSHLHFPATAQSAQRLRRLGERDDCIHVVGAPGLDDIVAFAPPPKEEVFARYGLEPGHRNALVVYHPVVQEQGALAAQMHALLGALEDIGLEGLVMKPNADAGGDELLGVLSQSRWQVRAHLPRDDYLALLAHVDVLVGNSSSGVIEAASYGTPVVNIGTRQQAREHNPNVHSVATDRAAIAQGLAAALGHGPYPRTNVYGDGHAGEALVAALQTVDLSPDLLNKLNGY